MDPAEAELTGRIRRWLTRGGPPPAAPEELNQLSDRLLRAELASSPKRALGLAQALERRARELRSPDLIYTATRAVARAQHVGGRHREALKGYAKARAMARERQDRRGRAQIDRALADVYMYLNRYGDARRVALRAVRAFRRLGAEADAVQAEVNLANLYHRLDRHADAEKIYTAAEDFFAGRDNPLAQARVAYNRGNTQVQLLDWEAARTSYRRAEAIYRAHDCALDATDARYGLAYLELLSDRFADALRLLTECERAYREGGDPRGAALCALDLAEAYLGLNLHVEALASARSAHRQFTRLKIRYETAKARLYLAWAQAGLGDVQTARRHARTALRGFERAGNVGMSAAARLLLAGLLADPKARRLALLAARGQFERAQLPIWSTLCDLQIFAQPARTVAVERRLARSRAVRRVPHWSALYDTLRGEHAVRAGRTDAARTHWRRAVRTLEAARAHLPPVELRTAYLAGRTDPYRRLIAVDARRDPHLAVEWAERLKTAGIWTPVVPAESADPEARRLYAEWQLLTNQLAALARTVKAEQGPGRALGAGQAERRMRALERRCRNALALLEARGSPGATIEFDLQSYFETRPDASPAILWHCSARDLYAFVVRGRQVQTHVWPHGVARLSHDLRRWRFFLERHMLAPEAQQDEATFAAERTFWSEVGEWLFTPLDPGIEEGAPVLIVPEGELFALPFAALRVRGEWLGDRYRFLVAPSLRHYRAACAHDPPSSGVEIFEASDPGLPAVRNEIDALVALLSGEPYRLHRPATREALLRGSAARLWHFAGHARFRADNPFYSSLQLADGPVFAADLRIRRVPVTLATLSACHSGAGMSAPGEEFSGFVRSILEMGARSVLAGLWPVADTSTAHWMSTFYRRWLGGADLSAAVRHAQEATREHWPSPYHWAAFGLFGSGR